MKSFDLNLRVETTGKAYSVIDLIGFLDAHTVNSFEKSFEEILAAGQNHIVIDLKDLRYISSAGIGALMGLTQELRRANGDLVLLRPNEKVFKILDLLGFTKIFNIAQNEEEILQFFTSSTPRESKAM